MNNSNKDIPKSTDIAGRSEETTHFGFKSVSKAEKDQLVGEVFGSVAMRYDLMNDLMSFGIHRWWKKVAVDCAAIRPGHKVLDLAGGSGDLTARISPLVGDAGQVVLADINSAMLAVARNRLIDEGLSNNIRWILANAEQLPFTKQCFDRIVISFGLRNVTDQLVALTSMYRVLKPGGRLLVLEFSKPTVSALEGLYELYLFKVLPRLGKWVAKDENSYRYLAESIRVHPDQEALREKIIAAGFDECRYQNLLAGIVAIHIGFKY